MKNIDDTTKSIYLFDISSAIVYVGGANNAVTGTTTTTNHNHAITTNTSVTSNFKRQNTIDSATIKENTARLCARPVKNTANLTNAAAVPLESSKFSIENCRLNPER